MKNILFNTSDSVLKVINKTKVIIYNLQNVIDISQNKIALEKYIIEGNDLIVKKMDEFEIEIIGNVETITLL